MMQLYVFLLTILIGSVLGREIGPIERKDYDEVVQFNDFNNEEYHTRSRRSDSIESEDIKDISCIVRVLCKNLPQAMKPILNNLEMFSKMLPSNYIEWMEQNGIDMNLLSEMLQICIKSDAQKE